MPVRQVSFWDGRRYTVAAWDEADAIERVFALHQQLYLRWPTPTNVLHLV